MPGHAGGHGGKGFERKARSRGCTGGAGCLTHDPRSRAGVGQNGKEANHKIITEALAAPEL